MLVLEPDMATEAAVAAAVEPDEMDAWSDCIRCDAAGWLEYMILAASVASGDAWPYDEV